MSKTKLTIKEIAEMAGVSPTAVSFVINGREGHIGQATRAKIIALIEESGYYPDIASRRMRMKKTFNIALFYPETASPFTDLFYADIVNIMIKQFSANEYNLIHFPLESAEEGYRLPRILKRHDMDGAILLQDADKSIFQELNDRSIPFLLLDWQEEDQEHVSVSLGCDSAISECMRYLARMGHGGVAFFGSNKLPYYLSRCLSGYQSALNLLGRPLLPEWVHDSVYDVDSAIYCIRNLMNCKQTPTAVCCSSDMCAIFAMQAANILGIAIPDTLSFISIDNIQLSRFVRPQLTTANFHKKEIALLTANMLLRMINGEKVESATVSAKGIIERQSVRDYN